jgi:hypothetical protein
MNLRGTTWKGESIEDVEILRELPSCLISILSDTNGFILHEGAVHVRGACLTPEWHSLRAAWQGPKAFHSLYDDVRPSDIPFAQDQVGDQFLIRDGSVLRLSAETGEIERLADSIQDFFSRASSNIEGFLNVGLGYKMQPGQLFCAFPPFCVQQSGLAVNLTPQSASDVILFHADLARQIRDIPDGGRIEFKMTN